MNEQVTETLQMEVEDQREESMTTEQEILLETQAREALEKNEKELREMTEGLDVVVFSMDMVKNEFIQMSPACEKVFGRSRESLMDNPDLWQKSTHPADMHLLSGEFEKLSKGETVICENRIFHTDNSVRWIERRITPHLNENGRLVRANGVATDITARKTVELEREKMLADLVRKNNDLVAFFNSSALKLRASLPQDGGVEALLNQGISCTTDHKTPGMELGNVIRHFEGISEIRKEILSKNEKVKFSRVTDDVRTALNDQIRTTKARIHANFDEIDEIFSSKSSLHSIFYNLVLNSIKYRNPKTVPRIEIRSFRSGDKVLLVFSDNGVGMNLKTNPDDIFQLNNHLNNSAEARGIGLYITKQQVEALGGKISVRSRLNIGTEFTLTFNA